MDINVKYYIEDCKIIFDYGEAPELRGGFEENIRHLWKNDNVKQECQKRHPLGIFMDEDTAYAIMFAKWLSD